MWAVLFKSTLGACWSSEGPAAALELEKNYGFLSPDLTKGISRDNTPVRVSSLHIPETGCVVIKHLSIFDA